MVSADGLTGAELESCIKTAMFNAFYEDREYNIEDISNSLIQIVPLIETKKEEIIALRQWAKSRARRANDYSITGISETTDKKGKQRMILHT